MRNRWRGRRSELDGAGAGDVVDYTHGVGGEEQFVDAFCASHQEGAHDFSPSMIVLGFSLCCYLERM